MSNIREIPLPEENPLNIVVADEAVAAKPKTRKKKVTDETPAPAEGAEA